MEVLGVKKFQLPRSGTPGDLTRAATSMGGSIRMDGMTVELRSKFSGQRGATAGLMNRRRHMSIQPEPPKTCMS